MCHSPRSKRHLLPKKLLVYTTLDNTRWEFCLETSTLHIDIFKEGNWQGHQYKWFNFISHYFYHIQDVKPRSYTRWDCVISTERGKALMRIQHFSWARMPAVTKISSQDLTEIAGGWLSNTNSLGLCVPPKHGANFWLYENKTKSHSATYTK